MVIFHVLLPYLSTERTQESLKYDDFHLFSSFSYNIYVGEFDDNGTYTYVACVQCFPFLKGINTNIKRFLSISLIIISINLNLRCFDCHTLVSNSTILTISTKPKAV